MDSDKFRIFVCLTFYPSFEATFLPACFKAALAMSIDSDRKTTSEQELKQNRLRTKACLRLPPSFPSFLPSFLFSSTKEMEVPSQVSHSCSVVLSSETRLASSRLPSGLYALSAHRVFMGGSAVKEQGRFRKERSAPPCFPHIPVLAHPCCASSLVSSGSAHSCRPILSSTPGWPGMETACEELGRGDT